MRPLPALLTCLSLTLLAAPASAAPIRVTIEGKNDAYGQAPDYRVHPEGVLGHFTLTDEFMDRGVNLGLGSPAYGNGTFVWRPEPYTEAWSGGWADLTLTFDRLAEGPPLEGSPTIRLVGSWGGVIGVGEDGRAYGRGESAPISATLANWTTDADIPQDVVDLFLDPRAVSFQMYVTGGRHGYVVTALRIDPAVVPEPATLAAWGVVGLGALAIRHRRRTSMAKASTS